MNWAKEMVVAKLSLTRIHFLIIKLFIVKGFIYVVVKVFH